MSPLRRKSEPKPQRVHPDLKTDVARSYLRVEIDGRSATIGAEAFVPGHGSPDFEVYRAQISWDDGGTVDEQDRSRIVETILASAEERGLRIEAV